MMLLLRARTVVLSTVLAWSVSLVVPFVPNAAASNSIVTTDLLRVRRISAIDVAADGSRAVFVVRSIGLEPAVDPAGEPAHINQSHLYLVDLRDRNARARPITHGARIDHSPRLSPDGRRIAFVRGRDDVGASAAQVWVLPTDGGEAWAVTDFQHGAASPRWAPDGRTLLVTSPVAIDDIPGAPPWPRERVGPDPGPVSDDVTPRADGSREEIRAWLDRNAGASDPHVITRLRFQDEQQLAGPLRFGQLFLVDPDERDAAPVQVTRGHWSHQSAEFMPDGKSIVYSAVADPSVHPDRQFGSALRRVDVTGQADRELLSVDGWSLTRPIPSSDGAFVAFLGSQLDEPAFRPQQLGTTSTVTPEPIWLTSQASFDSSVRAFCWAPTRSSLLFSAPQRGGVPLFTMGMGLIEPTQLVDQERGLPVGVNAFDAAGGVTVYAVTSVTAPSTLRIRDARGDRLVFDANEWTHDRTLSIPIARTITRPDGLEVQYWLMEPTRRSSERQYPVVLEIHGGPSAMWGPGEFSMWHEFQLLCSWGYGVVYANPRGSGGYGYEFQRGNYQDWGAGPAGDVLAALDDAMVREDWIDPDRLVVTGGSYGGYLTAWIVANDHRFKAAVAQRGVYDLTTFFGEGNAWVLVDWSMGGMPWDPRVRPVLKRESPFTWVNRIRTPLMIMHASRDLRTGVSQSEMMYRALKQLDRPVEYVRYPNAGHDLSRTGAPHQRLDRLNRIIEFFDRAVDNPRLAPRAGRSLAPAGAGETGN